MKKVRMLVASIAIAVLATFSLASPAQAHTDVVSCETCAGGGGTVVVDGCGKAYCSGGAFDGLDVG